MKNQSFGSIIIRSIRLLLMIVIFVPFVLNAQAPEIISYQAIVRDAAQDLVRDQQIGVKISILQGQAEGNAVYTEIQYPLTNVNGLVSFEFGGESGFENINWANGPFFLEISIDIAGGNDYNIIATTQLLSVPYALHATTAGTLTQEFVEEEVDPVFQSSVAAEIIQNDIVNWNTAFSWGDHDSLYLHHGWVPDWSDVANRPEAISGFALDAGGNVISNLAPAIEPGDAVTKEYVDFLLARIAAVENFLDMGASFEVPTVSLDSVWGIGETTVNASGVVTDNGGSDLVFSRGFVWSTAQNPDLDNYLGISNEGPQMGAFTSTLAGLSPTATYYIRAYARNVSGAGYSEQLSFTIQDYEDFVIDIDDNVYATVEINGWLWMAENLKVTRYNDGSDITKLTTGSEWSSASSGAYTVYPHQDIEGIDSEQDMMNVYGALYNWMSVNDNRGLCPAGWRLPSDEEWKELELFLGMDPLLVDNTGWRGYNEGGKLKSTRTEPEDHPRWLSPNTMAQDLYGYRAIPSGFRSNTGIFSTFEENGLWWTSTANAGTSAWYRSIMFDRGTIGRFTAWNEHGFSVRCIKDSE